MSRNARAPRLLLVLAVIALLALAGEVGCDADDAIQSDMMMEEMGVCADDMTTACVIGSDDCGAGVDCVAAP